MVKRFIIAIVLVLLICGGLIGFNMFRDQKIAEFFANMPVKTATVSATTVTPQEWHPAIDAIGSAKAVQGVDLAFETTGVVRAINFKSNDRVKAGQVLIQLDDDVEQAQLPGAESALETAEAQFDRIKSLRTKGVAAQKDLEAAEREVNAARSELARLEAVIQQKALKAPFSGVIGIPQIDVGAYVQPGTVVATLQDLDRMYVDFTVPEQRADELSLGQAVRFGPDAQSLDHEGRIIGINPKVDENSRLILVRAEADNRDDKLIPGQFLQVRVELPPQPDTIVLPQTALVTSLYGDYVFTLEPTAAGKPDTDDKAGQPEVSEGGQQGSGIVAQAATTDDQKQLTYKATQVFVKPGRRLTGLVEIVSGLKPGQLVVTSGQNKIQNGSIVTINNSVDPAKLAQSQ
ncbi:efflux RND transporter periplasmic adaptor subunit [Rhodoligotrophos defluvii]|uniref:efflux RND transporter periplasmic adaptor subunit n=1 Tax=Rhodoligotrophos defluvii TaxID=2561934 RepID=UPI0010C97472|nr:efflux RND transporter periplasmic adaptor subunit [Rhodoligotrophos defluvii]